MKRLFLNLFLSLIALTLWAQTSGGSATHKIQPGETLVSIAQRYGTTVEAIQELNPTTLRYVYAGMTLTLPASVVVEEQPKEPEPQVTTATIPQDAVKRIEDAIGDVAKVEVIERPAAHGKNSASMQLNYSTFTHANPSTIRNSSGRVINGFGEQSVIVRGDELHITDHTLHLHTILRPQQDIVYIYSDVVKRGLQLKYDYYVSMYMTNLARREASGGFETRNYQVSKTGTTKHEQYKCTTYSGKITTPSQQASVDLWECSDYGTSTSLRYLLDGIDVEGIPVRYVIERHGLTSYALNSGSVAAELKSVEVRTVSDEEMLPSADIRITISNKSSDVVTLWQDNLNYLKKNDMYPADAEEEPSLRYTIDGEWDL